MPIFHSHLTIGPQNLSLALGRAVLTLLDAWEAVTTVVTPFEPMLILCVGLCGLGGLTLSLALAADLLNIITWHVDTLHTLFAFLYSHALTALFAFWRLFRGKKRNVLRGDRIDSCDYDVDQARRVLVRVGQRRDEMRAR